MSEEHKKLLACVFIGLLVVFFGIGIVLLAAYIAYTFNWVQLLTT